MIQPPPALRVARFQLTIITNAHVEISPYSFSQTGYDFMGDMWGASVDLTHLDRRESAQIMRWVASLRGPIGIFELPAFDYDGPFGVMTGNPTIAQAADARAKTITLAHVAGSGLVQDDQITIGGHLHIVITAGAVDGADQQVIEIWPRLRASVAIGQAVNATSPTGRWRLARPENGFDRAQNFARSQSLALIEAL